MALRLVCLCVFQRKLKVTKQNFGLCHFETAATLRMQLFHGVEDACNLGSLYPHHNPWQQMIPNILNDDVNLFQIVLQLFI